MSGTPGKAEGADRDDSLSTGVAIPSRQLAYEAPTISRVMSEQRGDSHLETSTSQRDRYGTPSLPPSAPDPGSWLPSTATLAPQASSSIGSWQSLRKGRSHKLHVQRAARLSVGFWAGPSVSPPSEGQGFAGEPPQGSRSGSRGRPAPQTRPASQLDVQPFKRAAALAKAAVGGESRPRSQTSVAARLSSASRRNP